MHRYLVFLIAFACATAHAQSLPDESDPTIASVIFYSQSYAIERLQKWCEAEHPASSKGIKAAREEWDRIHKPLWNRVPGILKERFSKDERMEIAVGARLQNDQIVATLAAAPESAQATWCREAPERILSDELSLMGRTKLVEAITGS
ncbi:MAG: hypothetical protein GY937_09205 [bacterium]|nr:hypothetical protein [bacterium]MCP5056887.1 hypothetical protein [bacterium]